MLNVSYTTAVPIIIINPTIDDRNQTRYIIKLVVIQSEKSIVGKNISRKAQTLKYLLQESLLVTASDGDKTGLLRYQMQMTQVPILNEI